MYVAKVPNRGSPPAVLLRESYREAGKVKNRTLANLSAWPEARVDALSRVLKRPAAARRGGSLRGHRPRQIRRTWTPGGIQAKIAAWQEESKVRSAQLSRPAMSWPLHLAGASSPSPGTRPARLSSCWARRKHSGW
jgi:hypothetical protein